MLVAAEIEPGHANASKYLRATEQHMVQLGIPVGSPVQPQSRQHLSGVTAAVAADSNSNAPVVSAGLNHLPQQHTSGDPAFVSWLVHLHRPYVRSMH